MAVSTVEFDYEPVSDTGMRTTHFRVDESERRQGVGTAVMRALLARFAADGYQYVVVNMCGGDAARRFLTSELVMTLAEGPNPDGFVTAETELQPPKSQVFKRTFSANLDVLLSLLIVLNQWF